MEEEKVYLDEYETAYKHISLTNFLVLSFLTFGIYPIWWMYKSWKFFKEKDQLDVMPAARAIFSIFFFHGLAKNILEFAESKEYKETYNPTTLLIAYIVCSFASRLPDPAWLISFASILCFIPLVKAYNFALTNSEDHKSEQLSGFTGKQIGLIVLGIIFWALVILGLMAAGDTPDTYYEYDYDYDSGF